MPVAEYCIRGCTIRDEHYAACPDFGKTGATCWGCKPRPTRGATLVCDGCFKRFRRMLLDAPDLLGRLQSIAEQDKAVAFTPVKAKGSPAESPVQIGSDLLDALTEISANLHDWSVHLDAHRAAPAPTVGMSSTEVYAKSARDAGVVLSHLETIVAVEGQLSRLAEAVIVMHQPDDQGARRWSVADAVARWGVERRDRHVFPSADAEAIIAGDPLPVREWYDPLITLKQAAAHVGVTERQVQKWVKADELPPRARSRDPRGYVTQWFHVSAVEKVAQDMAARRHMGRKGTRHDLADREPAQE